MNIYVDLPIGGTKGYELSVKCTKMVLSIPGWSKGVYVLVHRKLYDPEYWSVTDSATLLRIPVDIGMELPKLRKDAISMAMVTLDAMGEASYDSEVTKALHKPIDIAV